MPADSDQTAGLDRLLDPPLNLPPALDRRLRLLDTTEGLSRLRTAIAVLLFLAFAACLAKGADGPPDPALAQGEQRSRVEGFGEVGLTVQPGLGLPSTTEFCALVAEDRPAWERGMMGRRDLAGYDAMLFRFPEDQDTPFYNRNVPIALSIAWFDSSGLFVSATDMAPCGDRDDCPLSSSGARYRFGLEVPQGGLARLGVGPGSVLTPTGPCSPR